MSFLLPAILIKRDKKALKEIKLQNRTNMVLNEMSETDDKSNYITASE